MINNAILQYFLWNPDKEDKEFYVAIIRAIDFNHAVQAIECMQIGIPFNLKPLSHEFDEVWLLRPATENTRRNGYYKDGTASLTTNDFLRYALWS